MQKGEKNISKRHNRLKKILYISRHIFILSTRLRSKDFPVSHKKAILDGNDEKRVIIIGELENHRSRAEEELLIPADDLFFRIGIGRGSLRSDADSKP